MPAAASCATDNDTGVVQPCFQPVLLAQPVTAPKVLLYNAGVCQLNGWAPVGALYAHCTPLPLIGAFQQACQCSGTKAPKPKTAGADHAQQVPYIQHTARSSATSQRHRSHRYHMQCESNILLASLLEAVKEMPKSLQTLLATRLSGSGLTYIMALQHVQHQRFLTLLPLLTCCILAHVTLTLTVPPQLIKPAARLAVHATRHSKGQTIFTCADQLQYTHVLANCILPASH